MTPAPRMAARMSTIKRESHFSRDKLPDPASYFEREGLRMKGTGAWRSAICPFHEDRAPSLSVNLGSGGFVCHACGAHGGDILEFHRLRYGLNFKQAARDLGAWQ